MLVIFSSATKTWKSGKQCNNVGILILIYTFSRNLYNYFRLHVCLSFRTSVRPYVTLSFFQFPAVVSQNVTNKTCLACVENEKYASWVIIRPQWDCCCRGEAEVRIIDFKTTWSEFQMPSQTAPAEAKPRCVYSILKPHGQSSITSPDSVPSSCVRQHT